MGNSTQTKSKNISDNYLFVKSITQGKSIYKHKLNGKQYLTLERTFPTSQMLLAYEQRMTKLLSTTHPYFLNQTQHCMLTTSTLCSIQYRVIHYFQHQPHTLQQQLQTRKLHYKPFQQKQIWSILCGVVLALAYLTKQEILCYTLHPKNIVIDKLGMIKVLSPLITDNGMQLLEEGFYYSPQHMKALKTSTFSTLTNKSSVFTLGITLLHILSLQPMNELYDYEKCTINIDLLSQLVDKVTQTDIKIVLKKMLKYHTYERITFTELEEMLFNLLEGGEDIGVGDGKSASQGCEQEGNGERLAVHRQAYQSAQYEMQSNAFRNHSMQASQHLLTYSTGNHYNETTLQPTWPDRQDRSHLFIYDSNIDYPVVDEKDTILSNQVNNGRLQSSNLLQNKSQMMIMMKSQNYQYTNNNNYVSTRTALREMSNSNNNMINITNNNNTPSSSSVYKQKQSFLKPQSKIQQSILDNEQTTRPVHVRQELSIGIYEGYKLNNFRHGYGVFHYSQGGKYIGQWCRNKMQGRGALYYANQQIAYEGEWINDKLHGFGILYNQSPTFMPQPFDFKSLHMVDNYWTKYEGNFYQDEKYGEGTLFLSNGEYYRGFFKQGLPHGNGVFRTVNNDIVSGNWVLGVMQ